MEPSSDPGITSPGLLRVGGATVMRHQLVLALAAGCQRILCMARGFGPLFAELQRDAEEAGAAFHVVSGARGLSGLVSAADEVLVFAEGLLATPGDALGLIDGAPAVLVLPSDTGIPAGFERIDLNHASAGLMLLPGRLVDRLMELPADIDPAGALLRIALQAGVPLRAVPDAVFTGGRWLLIRGEGDAHAAEDRWMMRHTAEDGRTPGPWLARFLVRRFGAALLHEGGSTVVGAGIAALLAVLALSAGWFGYVGTGLMLCAIGWVIQRGVAMLIALQRDALGAPMHGAWHGGLLEGGFDLVLVVLLTTVIPPLPGQLLIERALVPVVLIGLTRLLPRGFSGHWLEWLQDRVILIGLLLAMAAGRILSPGMTGLVLLLLAIGLILPQGDSRKLSRDIT